MAECLRFDRHGFEGCHVGYGVALRRRIMIGNGKIHIVDTVFGVRDGAPAEAAPVTIGDGPSF